MATSSLKTPIRMLSPQGVKALCDAYDEGVTKDLKFKPSASRNGACIVFFTPIT